jgi:hypothetical protein
MSSEASSRQSLLSARLLFAVALACVVAALVPVVLARAQLSKPQQEQRFDDGGDCVTLQGRVSVWKNDAYFVTPCWSLSEGGRVNVSAMVSTPNDDETYSVGSWVSPVEEYYPDHHCEMKYSACELPFDWASCVYTGNYQPIRSDFVVDTCGKRDNPVVQLACLKTPGFFNGKCQLQYSVRFCRVNSTSTSEEDREDQSYKCLANWQAQGLPSKQ